MYEWFKQFGKRFFPALLSKNEELIRQVIALKFKGHAHACTICNYKLSSFIERSNKDLLCPRCGSLGRSRRLFTLLDKIPSSKIVLHFSPPRALKYKLQSKFDNYLTSDFEGEFEADYSFDITNMEVEDHAFDIIICYHVLEHITDDSLAIKELFRVLKTGGQAFIQTPFSSKGFLEDLSINSPTERLAIYGQKDHVRIYTIDKLIERLESVGFIVEQMKFDEEKNNRFGFKVNETVLLAKK